MEAKIAKDLIDKLEANGGNPLKRELGRLMSECIEDLDKIQESAQKTREALRDMGKLTGEEIELYMDGFEESVRKIKAESDMVKGLKADPRGTEEAFIEKFNGISKKLGPHMTEINNALAPIVMSMGLKAVSLAMKTKRMIKDKGSAADSDAAYEENTAEFEDTMNTIIEEAIKIVCEKGGLQLEEGKLFVLTILKASGLNIGDWYGRKNH